VVTPLKKAIAEKRYSLPVGFLLREEGALLPAQILAGQRRGVQSSMSYDSVYPTLRPGTQARNRVGRELRRRHRAAMPRLWTRFDHRAWTSPQAGPRCASRLDWDPSGSLHWLREDLHLSSTAFSPIHPLQFADVLSGITTALFEALFLGGGHAYAQRF